MSKKEIKIEVITDKPLSSMRIWQKWLKSFGVSLKFQSERTKEGKLNKLLEKIKEDKPLDL